MKIYCDCIGKYKREDNGNQLYIGVHDCANSVFDQNKGDVNIVFTYMDMINILGRFKDVFNHRQSDYYKWAKRKTSAKPLNN